MNEKLFEKLLHILILYYFFNTVFNLISTLKFMQLETFFHLMLSLKIVIKFNT